eukprot:scaffold8374_cov36-Tisochrysis_lutea.AAC.1
MVAGGVRENGLRRGVTMVGGSRIRETSACTMISAKSARIARRASGSRCSLLRDTRSTLASASPRSLWVSRPMHMAAIESVNAAMVGVGDRLKPPAAAPLSPSAEDMRACAAGSSLATRADSLSGRSRVELVEFYLSFRRDGHIFSSSTLALGVRVPSKEDDAKKN